MSEGNTPEMGEAPGLRERKRRETLERIAAAGMRLFTDKGYDSTTIDDIAAAAGISRRTFFHYFPSKDDILLSMQSGMGETVVAAVNRQSAEQPPLDAVRKASLEILAGYPQGELLKVDRLMRSSPAVQARKHATYVATEEMLFQALRARWSEPDLVLRMVALIGVGATRAALDSWSEDGGRRPVTEVTASYFDAMGGALPKG